MKKPWRRLRRTIQPEAAMEHFGSSTRSYEHKLRNLSKLEFVSVEPVVLFRLALPCLQIFVLGL
jgi:hypothetical protein